MRRYAAECVGTGVLVFAGLGSAVIAGDKIGFLGVGLAFGIVLVAMAYAIGPISGCHINPAVTAGLLASRKIGARDAAGYVVAQVVGAIVGAVLLLVVAKARSGGYDAGAQGFGSNGFSRPRFSSTRSSSRCGCASQIARRTVLSFSAVKTSITRTHRASLAVAAL